MKEIPLSRGMHALVDDDDFDNLSRFKWCVVNPSPTRWYAVRRDKKKFIYMHHVLLPKQDGLITDHIDGNGLNNQRQNLRRATPFENRINSRKRSNNTSGFIGVSWDAENKKWYVCIKAHSKFYNLGRFTDLKEAAEAYDLAAIALFGEMAVTNFPKASYRPENLLQAGYDLGRQQEVVQ